MAKTARLTKREEKYLERDVAKIQKSKDSRKKRESLLRKKYRLYLENESTYEPDEIDRIVEDQKRGVPLSFRKKQYKFSDYYKFKIGKKKVYQYATELPNGKKLKGQWITQATFKRRQRSVRYWDNIRRLVGTYEIKTSEARRWWRRMNDPEVSDEYRGKLFEALKQAGIDTPDLIKRENRARAEARRSANRKERRKRVRALRPYGKRG